MARSRCKPRAASLTSSRCKSTKPGASGTSRSLRTSTSRRSPKVSPRSHSLLRPCRSPTTTSDLSYALIDGAPTQVWTVRPKTQTELDADTTNANTATLLTKASQALTVNGNYLDAIARRPRQPSGLAGVGCIFGVSRAARSPTRRHHKSPAPQALHQAPGSQSHATTTQGSHQPHPL